MTILALLALCGQRALLSFAGGDYEGTVAAPGVVVLGAPCDVAIPSPVLWIGNGDFDGAEQPTTITYAACTPSGRLVIGFGGAP